MSTKEKNEVMQAWLDGELIEYCSRTPDGYSEWTTVNSEPVWNWEVCKYRVKSKPIYKPYYNVYELLRDAIRHDFLCIEKKSSTYYRLVISSAYLITLVHDGKSTTSITYQRFLEDYTWDDGSWCGDLVKD